MNLIMLNIFYYNGAFDSAYLMTKNPAGKTWRKLTKGKADVFRAWLKMHTSTTTDIYDSGDSRYVAIALIKSI